MTVSRALSNRSHLTLVYIFILCLHGANGRQPLEKYHRNLTALTWSTYIARVFLTRPDNDLFLYLRSCSENENVYTSRYYKGPTEWYIPSESELILFGIIKIRVTRTDCVAILGEFSKLFKPLNFLYKKCCWKNWSTSCFQSINTLFKASKMIQEA